MNIIYCRKSTDSEDRQVLSIPAQVEELKRLAERDNLKIDKIFTESMSAKAPGRPEFDKMLQLIKRSKNCTLLVWKLDRLARNPIDGGHVTWLLQQEIISEIKTYDRNYLPDDNILMMSVEFGMATQYSRDLSMNVKRGNRMKLEKGGWLGVAPFGYLNNKANHTVYIDPERSKFVVKFFELFATGGYSIQDLVKMFYKQGLRSHKGNKVHASLWHRVINNPFYTGVLKHNGKLYPGIHQPLISKELFDNCQAMLKGNRSSKQKHMFPLRGYVNCADCGCMVTASMARGHQYYHCTNGKKTHQAREFVRAESLNEQIVAEFAKVPFDEELVEMMYQAAKEKSGFNVQFVENAKAQIASQLKLLQDKRQRVEDVFVDGSMTKDRYEARILDLNNEEVELRNQLKQLEQKVSLQGQRTIEQTKKAFLTAVYAEKDFLCGDDNKKRQLAEILLSNIKIQNRKIQCLQFKRTYQLMFSAPKKLDFSIWQGV